jgi:cytochrome c oxidase cbb3-type subunit 4
MFKHYFEQIEGIEIYPLVSLLIFFIFFLLLILWVIKVDKKYITKMKGLPFEAGDLHSKEHNNG